jgi:hypothetical protein
MKAESSVSFKGGFRDTPSASQIRLYGLTYTISS